MGATIRDVARRAGVSTATVSLALNGDPRVAGRTRAKVIEAARELGYRPSTAARVLGLKKGRGGLDERYIGVVCPALHDVHAASILSGIEVTATQAHYGTLFSDAGGNREAMERSIERLVNHGCLGLIVMPPDNGAVSPKVADLLSREYPLVLVDRWWMELPAAPRVLWDDYRAARAAVEHLIQRGYAPVACAHGDLTQTSSVRDRIDGYRGALVARGVSVTPNLVRPSFAAKDLLNLTRWGRRPAVFAIHDYLACDIFTEAMDAGIAVPGRLGIMGFGGYDFILRSSLPISTMVQDREAMGVEAFRLLQTLIEGPDIGLPGQDRVRVLPCTLMDRMERVG